MVTYTRYKHLAIAEAQPSPTAAELEAIEAELGATLPVAFREFLQVANGGCLEYVVEVPLNENQSEALSFSGILRSGEGEHGTFLGELRSAREYAKVPKGVLPFAQDGGGSTLFLDLTPEGRGRVVAFVHGLPEWTGLRRESGYVELAASFEAYVASLRLDRESILDHLELDAEEPAHVDATEAFLDVAIPDWRSGDEALQLAVQQARRRVEGLARPARGESP